MIVTAGAVHDRIMGRVDSMSGGKSCRIVWTASKRPWLVTARAVMDPARETSEYASSCRAYVPILVCGSTVRLMTELWPLPLETIGRGKPVERRRIVARNLALSLA